MASKFTNKIRDASKFGWTNLDAILVMVISAVVVVLEIAGEPKTSLVNGTILALLGVTAFILLRDRGGRRRVDEIADFVADLHSDLPYEIQTETNRWDIRDRGASATFKQTKRLRLLRNYVSTLDHWTTSSSGRVTACESRWKLHSSPAWSTAPTVRKFPIDSGDKYIFSLDSSRTRGEILDWEVTRELRDRFPEDRESVSVKVRNIAHELRLEVAWPTDRDPLSVEVNRGGRPGQIIRPERNNDGCLQTVEEFADHRLGEEISIEWTW